MSLTLRPFALLCFGLLAGGLCCGQLAAESRMWTSTEGKNIQAELVDVLNGEAVLKVAGQTNTVRVPFARLSEGDREFIKSWKKPGAPVPEKQDKSGKADPKKPAEPKKPGAPKSDDTDADEDADAEDDDADAKNKDDKDKDAEEETNDATGFPIGVNSVVKRDENGWPEVVALKEKPAFTVVKEDKTEDTFIYRSDHFEFTSTQRLSGEIVREFSRVFETSFEAVVCLPLRLNPKPPAGFFKVKLFATADAYYTAGGIPGSAGMYTGRTKEIMVPLPFLGVKQIGQRWVLDDRDGNHTLVHEVVHQVMHDWLIFLPTWVTEGIAEYITAGRYSNGRLTLRGHGKNMEEYKDSGDRETKVVALDKLMSMDDETWARALTTGGAGANYRTSMLLFYFFCHEDGDKTGKAMIDYFKARRKKYGDDKAERESILIRGRDGATLMKDFKKGLASVGIRLS